MMASDCNWSTTPHAPPTVLCTVAFLILKVWWPWLLCPTLAHHSSLQRHHLVQLCPILYKPPPRKQAGPPQNCVRHAILSSPTYKLLTHLGLVQAWREQQQGLCLKTAGLVSSSGCDTTAPRPCSAHPSQATCPPQSFPFLSYLDHAQLARGCQELSPWPHSHSTAA